MLLYYNQKIRMSNAPILDLLCEKHPLLNSVKNAIGKAAEMLIGCYFSGGKLLVCGNGGSCSDSEHIVGELMISFELKRSIKKDNAEKLTEVSPERGNYLAQKLKVDYQQSRSLHKPP